ncbi:MAG TPA: biotin--[acetyl-CoA-carboxylase] ligase [Terriglobales bacterium]|nr:biotin--[acetyl-CoA-carboxylase] ligase [Terriglobales bacterium]
MAHNSRIKSSAPSRRGKQAALDLSARTDERLGRILRVLQHHAMLVVSGTRIAEEMGASRSAVWRLIQQLRALGVEIAGHPTTGYQLKKVPDLLLPELLAPLVKGTIFRRVHHYFRIGSTNTAAMQAAAAGEPEGTVFLAEEQSAGHGRGGHSWHSEPSTGIYCSAILRPGVAPADVLALSLAAGLAASAAVQEVTGLQPDLRWPNDLLLAEKKFCGILTEMNAEVTRVRYAVVGVGINVNQEKFPADLHGQATSLRLETGQEWSRVALAGALLKSLDREYRALAAATGPDAGAAAQSVFRRFEERSSYARGKRVEVEEDSGYAGVTEGLDARGFLKVRTAAGLRTVLSGGVRAFKEP